METSNEAKLYYGIIVGMLAVLILIIGVIAFFYKYQRRLLFRERQVLIQDAQYKQDLLTNTINSVEVERKRIASDIHDELGSLFSTLGMMLNRAINDPNKENGLLSDCKTLVNNGVQRVRVIAHQIMPYELEYLGLQAGVEKLLKQSNLFNIIDFRYHCNPPELIVKSEIEIAAYRIIQELISNMVKYAKATIVTISIKIDATEFELLYKDNGIGLPENYQSIKSGMGFKNIESRVLVYNGKIAVESKPDNGLFVKINYQL